LHKVFNLIGENMSLSIQALPRSIYQLTSTLFLTLSLSLPLMALNVQPADASPVNVNTANQTELETIKGIGPSKARAILSEREKGGVFRDSSDLQSRVRGIGERSLNKMVDHGLKIETPSAYRETKSGVRKAARESRRNTQGQSETRAQAQEQTKISRTKSQKISKNQ
jgi:competence protein ComEA